MLRVCAAIACLALCSPAFSKEKKTELYSHGDPTPDEQYVLQMINRARADPAAEGRRLKLDMGEGLAEAEQKLIRPKPPLAMNAKLLATARKHSEDMFTNNFFQHINLKGKGPLDRILAGGYKWYAAAENIAMGSDHTAAELHDILMIDAKTPNKGHRKHVLEIGLGDFTYREVGIGFHTGKRESREDFKDYITQNFGVLEESPPLLLGVVYEDKNENGQYDIGEGIAGASVKADKGKFSAITSTSGGYAFPAAAGRRKIRVRGDKFQEESSATVVVANDNIQIDFIAGKKDGVINFGIKPPEVVVKQDTERRLPPPVRKREAAEENAVTVDEDAEP
jgi:uncharacterized protein YkwD